MCEVCPCNMKGQTLVITGVEGIPTNKQNKVFHTSHTTWGWTLLGPTWCTLQRSLEIQPRGERELALRMEELRWGVCWNTARGSIRPENVSEIVSYYMWCPGMCGQNQIMKDCHAMRLMKRIGPIDEEKPLLIMPTTALHLGHLADVLFQSDENKERKVKHYITVDTVRMFIEPSFVITLDCDALRCARDVACSNHGVY